ncbi:hypothetical protein PM082_008965 [Marasmius tenuissimus]|nr:hypothetical protein PM082_008965 [Marasmius tenuissimus]
MVFYEAVEEESEGRCYGFPLVWWCWAYVRGCDAFRSRRRAQTICESWTTTATGAGAGVVGGRTSTLYPPEKQRYSNMSTSSSAPLLGGASGSGSGSRPQHSRHNQSQSGSVVTLSPPDVESASHYSYFDPYADPSSSSNDDYRSMKVEQR